MPVLHALCPSRARITCMLMQKKAIPSPTGIAIFGQRKEFATGK